MTFPELNEITDKLIKIDLENNKVTITKTAVDNLFRLDTYEAFEKALEEMLALVPECLMAVDLFNYLKDKMEIEE